MFKKTMLLRVLFLTIAALGSTAAHAQVLVSGPATEVKVSDVSSDAQRLPEPRRQQALSRPDAVQQLATGIYLRKALTQEAVHQKLENDPSVVAALMAAREQVLAEAALQALDKQNEPTEQALEAAAAASYRANTKRFEEPALTRARHILLREKSVENKAKLEGILGQLKAGAPFDAMAQEHSEDPGSKRRGGDLGFFQQGRMVKEFEDALAKLQNPGELSGVVESQFGYHIIKLEQRRPAQVKPFEQVRDELKKEVRITLLNEGRDAKRKQLLDAAKFNVGEIEAFANKAK